MFGFFKRKLFGDKSADKTTAEPAAAPAVPPAVERAAPAAVDAPAVAPAAAAAAIPSVPAAIPAAPVAEPVAALAPIAEPEPTQRKSWLGRLKAGLSRTGQSISMLFVGAKVDDALLEELESALLMADAGVEATQLLLDRLRRRVKDDKIVDAEQVRVALRELLAEHLRVLERPFVLDAAKPLVVMVAGVNGAGKTTSIGKLARHMQAAGCKVLLAAGDTFRAAAREQLQIWGERNNVHVIAQESGDPAAVVFDSIQAGAARGIDVVIADTAGRLPTQLHLMDELRKMRRVATKAMAGAPHEVLLVIDGNTGQNALAQVKAFDDALGLTGLIVTKLDGTAKGGVLCAIAAGGLPGSRIARPIPVYFIGVGEKLEDLQAFSADEFAEALLG
ncbi:signal recognition particle-docking protein FtsY [Derxia lacustris]|uniref:signal recognition particle-docking protein FtsY n=1 Tax=Derxia lacustris TaxID=764842 RepID=UPI000A16EEF9|nr:signal recognition particle-docking protein FtsY [Derxia lacustris]